MRTLLVALAMLVTASAANSAAAAVEYPWCADLGRDIGATNCGFVTIEQCRATVSGIGGSCVPNPFYYAAMTERPPRSRKTGR